MSDLIYVINRSLQSVAPVSIKEFCMETPRGAYTTLQIVDNFFAVDFDLHIERLIKSIAAVHASLNSCYANYYAALAEGKGSEEEAAVLQAAMLPSLLVALATAENRSQQPTIATIIVSPNRNQATTPASSLTSSLDIHVVVASSPSSSRTQQGAQAQNNNKDTTTTSTFAVVLGPPRDVPIGKDSGWVAQRQSLEALRPPGAAEVLLATQQGALLEGLVTNLFVLVGLETGEIVVQTAGMGDGVVWGTMRQRVLQVCEKLGLKIVKQSPAAGERASWKEAFLTNALRGVQPLDRIECDERNVWGLEPWEITFSEVPGPWTFKIKALVDSSLQRTDLRKI